jgi:hypothetical protein
MGGSEWSALKLADSFVELVILHQVHEHAQPRQYESDSRWKFESSSESQSEIGASII